MSEPIDVHVQLRNLSVGYDSDLISGINQVVKSGEIISIVGVSGIGKTTLLRTIAGLIQPLSGEVSTLVPKRGG
ncbi:MAG: hypothetical protein CMA25_05375, partial [Euryarchaeota archaeon]|nr:hypothetical protein [Euryarchaeota archaeon]